MGKISLTLLMLVFILSSCAEVGSEQGNIETTFGSTSETTQITNSKGFEESQSKSLTILDSNSREVELSKEEESLLLKYLLEAMENNEECERLKYIFPNQIIYIDEDSERHYFSFLAPTLVEGDKESMLSVEAMNGDGHCIRIDRKFFELLKEIAKSKGSNFSGDA